MKLCALSNNELFQGPFEHQLQWDELSFNQPREVG